MNQAPRTPAQLAASRPVARTQATPDQRVAHMEELRSKAERLLILKDRMAVMQQEADLLTDEVKTLLQAGYRTEVGGRRPVLRPSRRRRILFHVFQEVFGQKLCLECAAIDLKAVDTLVHLGRIARQDVARVTEHVMGAPALHWSGDRPVPSLPEQD